jgi:hypothetical protein
MINKKTSELTPATEIKVDDLIRVSRQSPTSDDLSSTSQILSRGLALTGGYAAVSCANASTTTLIRIAYGTTILDYARSILVQYYVEGQSSYRSGVLLILNNGTDEAKVVELGYYSMGDIELTFTADSTDYDEFIDLKVGNTSGYSRDISVKIISTL